MKNNPNFITIEGIDGSGKSTFIPLIEEMFKNEGFDVVLTREPGGTDLGQDLREMILNRPMDKETELLLAFASRREHIKEVIEPALQSGKVVISDRFTDSSYAYQASGRGVDKEKVRALERMVQGDLNPGLTLIFTVPTSVSRARLNKTGKVPDKFESQEEEFFQRVIKGYEDRFKECPRRCVLIDSSKTIEDTKEQVLDVVKKYFVNLKNFNRNRCDKVKNRP